LRRLHTEPVSARLATIIRPTRQGGTGERVVPEEALQELLQRLLLEARLEKSPNRPQPVLLGLERVVPDGAIELQDLADRKGEGPSGGPALIAGAIRSFLVVNVCGIPSSAKTVAINLAVVAPTDDGDLRVYPDGEPAPLASSINCRSGIVRSNNAIIPLGRSGQISVQCDMPSGGTHFFFDVYGYFQ